MCITEYNEKSFVEGIRAEGEIRGEVKTLYTRLKLSPAQIADEMNLTLDEVKVIIESL